MPLKRSRIRLIPVPSEIVRPVSVKLPIRLFWNYLVIVDGSIGNVQKLHFLVDTGAYPSIVDQKIARHLGLAEQPARVNLASKSVPTDASFFLLFNP